MASWFVALSPSWLIVGAMREGGTSDNDDTTETATSSYPTEMASEQLAEDDDIYRASMRSIFRNGNEDDESDYGDEQNIGQYVWHCPIDNANGKVNGDASHFPVIYHLALLAPGHGNSLWNACICIAEHLSSASKRSQLLGDDISSLVPWPPRSSLEFGAGAALPSMILLREGTDNVIITDRKVNDMTFEALDLSAEKNGEQWNVSDISQRVEVCDHTWGEAIDELVKKSNSGGIDVLVASDCIYNPTYHNTLLQSASGTICSERGIFIVGFSYHSNCSKEQVDAFFAKAEEFGFCVVSEFTKKYKEQQGIGSKDPERAMVYCKVLVHKDSIYRGQIK